LHIGRNFVGDHHIVHDPHGEPQNSDAGENPILDWDF
jgi:hypothetical protein